MRTRHPSRRNSWGTAAAFSFLAIFLLQPGWLPARAGPAVRAAAESSSGLVPAVVYVAGDGHVHEIALKGSWQDRDLTAAAAAPAALAGLSQPMAFRRSDGVSMVIYTGAGGHVHCLYLELSAQGGGFQEAWHWADLTAIAGSPAGAGDPVGYVRSDGISTVVYSGADGHIHDLRLESSWIWTDLTVLAGAPAASTSRPVAYVRGDGINAVVYKSASDGHVIELYLSGTWQWADLTSLAGAPLPLSDLSAYVRSEGISTVNFASFDGHIQDLRLETDWIWSDLTAISGAPATPNTPRGTVRADGINAILYATGGADPGRIYELRLENGWEYFELTSIPGAARGYRPFGYVRADGVAAVISVGGAGWNVHEFWLDTAWHWADLSYLAEAPGSDSYAYPYNRSAIAFIYLPLTVR